MACENIDQVLEVEAGRISDTIYRRTLHVSPWLDLVKQGSWEDEMGETIQVMVYERSLPTTDSGWADVGQSDGETAGGTCALTADKIEFGRTLREYNLQQRALESPRLCVNDLRISFKRKVQLSNIMSILVENTKWTWENRHRDEYVRLAEHKVIADASLTEATTWSLTEPTSKLTQGVLDRMYQKLIRDGGGANPLDRYKGAPQFLLITDSETSDALIRQNDGVRNDFRYSPRAEELLGPLGIERPYRGFFHAVDDFGPRYDFVGGAWVRRYPYKRVAASSGYKWEIDPLYEAAAYMDSIIFHQDVMECLIPKPISSVGAATFEPQMYRGDWKWLNIRSEDCNPDGTIGYFRGVFQSGSKPIHPQFGFVIRHLRCDPPLELEVCDT